METGRILSLAALRFLYLVCFWRVPLWSVIGAKVVVSPVNVVVTVLLVEVVSLGGKEF